MKQVMAPHGQGVSIVQGLWAAFESTSIFSGVIEYENHYSIYCKSRA